MTRLPASEIAPFSRWKTHDPPGDIAARAGRAVAPRPPLVPDEIVQHGGFHGNRRGGQVVKPHPAHEKRQHGELDGHTQHSDAVEGQPAVPGSRGSHAL